MINFKDCVYIDQKLGNDNNTGKSSIHPIKSITRAKELVSENGVIYIIGMYSTEKIEFKLSSKFYVINKDNCNYIISNDDNIIITDLNLINNNGFNNLSLMNPNVFKYIHSL